MDCKEFLELISLSLDGELTEASGDEFCAHSEECSSCGKELALARHIRESLGNITISPPENFEQNMLAALKNEKSKKAFPFKQFSYIAAGLILFIAIGGIMLSRQPYDNNDTGGILFGESGAKPEKTVQDAANDIVAGGAVNQYGDIETAPPEVKEPVTQAQNNQDETADTVTEEEPAVIDEDAPEQSDSLLLSDEASEYADSSAESIPESTSLSRTAVSGAGGGAMAPAAAAPKSVNEILDETGVEYTESDGKITVRVDEDKSGELRDELTQNGVTFNETADDEGNIEIEIREN